MVTVHRCDVDVKDRRQPDRFTYDSDLPPCPCCRGELIAYDDGWEVEILCLDCTGYTPDD